MEFRFEGEIVEWRGPAPFYFVPLPDDVAAEIKLVENQVHRAQVQAEEQTDQVFERFRGGFHW